MTRPPRSGPPAPADGPSHAGAAPRQADADTGAPAAGAPTHRGAGRGRYPAAAAGWRDGPWSQCRLVFAGGERGLHGCILGSTVVRFRAARALPLRPGFAHFVLQVARVLGVHRLDRGPAAGHRGTALERPAPHCSQFRTEPMACRCQQQPQTHRSPRALESPGCVTASGATGAGPSDSGSSGRSVTTGARQGASLPGAPDAPGDAGAWLPGVACVSAPGSPARGASPGHGRTPILPPDASRGMSCRRLLPDGAVRRHWQRSPVNGG